MGCSRGECSLALDDAGNSDLLSDHPRTAEVLELDRLSLQQLCEAAGFSDEAIEYMAVGGGVETLLPSAASEHVREEVEQVWSQRFDEIIGGTHRLASAFVERLKSKPTLGCEVTELVQDSERLRSGAVYVRQGVKRRVDGDFVLCTLPCPVLSRIEVHPSYGARNSVQSASSTMTRPRRCLQLRLAGSGNRTTASMGAARLRTCLRGRPGIRPTTRKRRTRAFRKGPASFSLCTHGDRQRACLETSRTKSVQAWYCSTSREYIPSCLEAGVVRQTASWSWDHHPLAGGAFAWFMPGQHSELHRHIVAPEGRIYFAGEHASLAHTWMQGALDSSLRAVRELLTAAQQS